MTYGIAFERISFERCDYFNQKLRDVTALLATLAKDFTSWPTAEELIFLASTFD